MATIPRYVGTNAATAVAYIQARLQDDQFLRVFDLDGDGVVASGSDDESALVAAVCSAETEVDEFLAASHGTPFTGTVPDTVREISFQRSLWCSVRLRANANVVFAPFLLLYQQTDSRLSRLAKDKEARIPTVGAPEPFESTEAATEDLGDAMPFTRATNRSNGWSGF